MPVVLSGRCGIVFLVRFFCALHGPSLTKFSDSEFHSPIGLRSYRNSILLPARLHHLVRNRTPLPLRAPPYLKLPTVAVSQLNSPRGIRSSSELLPSLRLLNALD